MKKNTQFFLIGIAVVLLAVVILFFLTRNRQIQRGSQAGEAQNTRAAFANQKDTSPDSVTLNRTIRGTVISVEGMKLSLSAMINWPDREVLKEIPLTLTDRTEYLCWPKVSKEGAVVEDSLFLLDDTTKLQLSDEKYLTKEQAHVMLNKDHSSVLLALEKNYVDLGENRVFQVAIIGCQ